MQALYSDEHRYLDGGYGVKYETAAIHPSLLVTFAPWRGAREHVRMMDGARALGADRRAAARPRRRRGEGRPGRPAVREVPRCRTTTRGTSGPAMDGAAQILEAAGARPDLLLAVAAGSTYEPGAARQPRAVHARRRRVRLRRRAAARYGSFHIMGSARMGGSPATSACNPQGETWDVRDLYVCDGSAFPTASGVNPMISIEAIAHMNASALAARLA